MNILGAFLSSNNMINNSYKLCLVLNVDFHSSPYFIPISWYPLFKSILEKIHDPYNSSNMSSSLGIWCLYFIVVLLMVWQLTHILQVPSFLGANNTSTTQGLILSWMYPFIICSSTCLWSSFVFDATILFDSFTHIFLVSCLCFIYKIPWYSFFYVLKALLNVRFKKK